VSVGGRREPADATTDGPGDRNNVTGAAIDALGTPDSVTGTVIDIPAPVDLLTSSATRAETDGVWLTYDNRWVCDVGSLVPILLLYGVKVRFPSVYPHHWTCRAPARRGRGSVSRTIT
jgi:hypothetical protein